MTSPGRDIRGVASMPRFGGHDGRRVATAARVLGLAEAPDGRALPRVAHPAPRSWRTAELLAHDLAEARDVAELVDLSEVKPAIADDVEPRSGRVSRRLPRCSRPGRGAALVLKGFTARPEIVERLDVAGLSVACLGDEFIPLFRGQLDTVAIAFAVINGDDLHEPRIGALEKLHEHFDVSHGPLVDWSLGKPVSAGNGFKADAVVPFVGVTMIVFVEDDRVGDPLGERVTDHAALAFVEVFAIEALHSRTSWGRSTLCGSPQRPRRVG